MPIVTIDMWTGRTKEQKEMLIGNMTRAVVYPVGCPLDAVHVIIKETDKGIGELPENPRTNSGLNPAEEFFFQPHLFSELEASPLFRCSLPSPRPHP